MEADGAVPSSGAAAKRGPSGAAQLYAHSSSVGVEGSWPTKAHTAALKKEILFPPQTKECLSAVSTLPWKHMVRFHCFGCTRGELKEKPYDQRRPDGCFVMGVLVTSALGCP